MRSGGTLLDGGRSATLARIAAAVALAASFGAGWLAFHQSKYALAIGALAILAGVAVADPIAVATLALPSTLILVRGGGSASGSNIAVADAMVAVGSLLALPLIRWDVAATLRRLLLAAGVYEVTLLLVVAAHPNSHDVLEGLHRLFIVSGSLIAGWAVARSGRAGASIKIFLWLSSLVGISALVVSLAHGFKPAYISSLGFQKNTIGAYMWISIAIVQIRPRWAELRERTSRVVLVCAILGLVGSQSKQAVIALAVVIFLSMIRHEGARQRSRTLAPLLIIASIIVYLIVSTQLTAKAGTFNSANIRLAANASDISVWKLDPLIGQGMRWFYLPEFAGQIQPTNILYEGLTDSGIIGVIAYTLTLAGVFRVLLRLPRDIGTLAMALVLGRLVEGLFDSYWIGAESSVPWIIVGMAVGVFDASVRQLNSPEYSVEHL